MMRIAFAVVVGVCMALWAPAAHAQTPELHYPANSVWKLDAAASDLGGFPSLKADTFTVEQDTAALFRWHDRTLLGDGRVVTSRYSYPEDGKPHLLDGGRDEYITVWPDGRSFWSYPDGTRVTAHIAFTDNGKTNIFSGSTQDRNGAVQAFRLVYRRQE